MQNKLYSAYPELAGKTLNWLPMDTQQFFAQNLKNQKHILDQYGWTTKSIKYEFNSDGFRTGEFKECDCVVFLGCSYTVGIGLPYHNTWPFLVAQELGLECYNLGLGGGSMDSMYRIGSYWIEKLNPKLVIALEPPSVRYEILPYGNINIHEHHVFENTIFTDLFRNEHNYELNKQKNINALKTFHNNIIWLENDPDWFDENHVDLARDLAHPGIQTNILIKEKALGFIDAK